MSTAHTQGTWRTEEPADIHTAVVASEGKNGSRVVALCFGPDQAANALLIQGAPALLAACRSALHALKGREHDGFLRDAILQATGAAA